MRIEKVITPDEFRAYVDSIQSCGDHPLPGLTPEVLASAVEVIDSHIEVSEDYEDTESWITVRLVDGAFGVFSEWADSSGHG